MNRCHHNAGHQGQQWTLCLLNNWFWLPGMAAQMQRAISSCKWCIKHEGIHAKAPMQPIIVTTPLELLCVDFTSIETTRVEWTPKCGEPFDLLWLFYNTHHGICDPPIKLKTFAKFLWQGYISIFGALAKLLSDQGANFESNIIRELCDLMDIWKVRTSPCHSQTNGHGRTSSPNTDAHDREIK